MGITRLQTATPCQPATVSQLSHSSCEQPWVGVIDARTGNDLDRIIAAVMQARQPLLLIGFVGICDAVARRSAVIPSPTVLTVIGSMNKIAQRQVTTLYPRPYAIQTCVDVERVLTGNASDYDTHIMQALQKGDHCIVCTCNDSVARYQIDILYRCQQMSRIAPGEKIYRFPGELIRQVLFRTMPDVLYLSGGDVAMAMISALGATRLRIARKVT